MGGASAEAFFLCRRWGFFRQILCVAVWFAIQKFVLQGAYEVSIKDTHGRIFDIRCSFL